ncbi:nitroreductase family protein [Testudinibacter sp. TR-2022]|uniref:nitroreductase family protein n=1 Tax=Testudinibacter sp. TR-2022 TaxID=2585029 RepID=UPI001117DEAA|nr:nitroreductase family protein [Testudinibacter sp. TR-2022]TNG99839.1 nitroreductase family protein [Pasteurellaceae bacterium Phil31]TNH05897.1 nitroreductase family protein [Testudinibacter sp. TR-2022]TNH06564.1 nitroreductase family protein [Testudinibacter sp. TR-2022]TNH14014.1 nitroreductase family protein [Testudinibacter sp. TR-2022]TNH15360.1 nitroreductase family protein [Testudinibacter sp. TR-2022]
MSKFNALQKNRRSIYSIGKNVTLSQDQLTALIKDAVREAPSSFNSQSSRAVILFGAEHERLWNIVLDTLRSMIPAEAFAATETKVNNCFKAGFGTVLYFEDQNVVTGLQQQFAAYADNFPIWSEQASGIAQYAVWLALAEAGIGATLQHYNPIIDETVAKIWDIPASWKLRAQMPFGSIEAAAGEKTYMEDEQRFKVFG